MTDTKETYTVKEFAEKIGVHEQTIYDWAEKGWIPVDPNGGIKILKFEMDLVREISILTNQKYSVVWGCMKEYILNLRDTFENVLERKGRNEVIREIIGIVEGKDEKER